MNTRYRKNLKDAMTACKNYTDTQIVKTKEEIYWHIGEYSVTTSDDNTSASVKTVPANATRCKIKRVYGNTQKLNPTTASDSTSAMMKTMPSTVYDFDVSKVEGNSEVSENLLVLSDVAETTTTQGIKYKVENGIPTLISGTANANTNILTSSFNLPAGTYYFKSFGATGSNTTYLTYIQKLVDGQGQALKYSYDNGTFTLTETTTMEYRFIVRSGETVSNVVFKDMLVKGTTAPSEFKVGFDGIHNFAWTGVKVEGANLFDLNDIYREKTYYFFGSQSQIGGDIGYGNTNNGYTSYLIEVEPNTTYYYTSNVENDVSKINYTTFIDSNLKVMAITSTDRTSILTPSNCKYLLISKSSTSNINCISKINQYADYIAPTTIPIDLSTILYNGNPLFEENALKGINDVKDSITPYKATKNVGQILGSTYESNIITATTSGGLTCVVIQTNENLIVNNQDTIVQLNNLGLTAMSASSQWTTTATNVIACNNQKRILINFDQSLTESEMIAKAKTLILNFAILTPIEVSINWASTLRGITGYSNGTITLLNTYNMDSANTITYNSIIKENCCAKMVQSRGGNVVKTINLPTQASDGWSAGSVANVRDFTTNKRIGNVGKENNLGTIDYTYVSANEIFRAVISGKATSNIQLCVPYETTTQQYSNMPNKTIRGRDTAYSNTNYIFIKDTTYTDATTFKTAMANEPLYYELADASKTSTDITPLEENVIVVQAGDTLSFYDSEDNLVTVPSDLTYRIEVER